MRADEVAEALALERDALPQDLHGAGDGTIAGAESAIASLAGEIDWLTTRVAHLYALLPDAHLGETEGRRPRWRIGWPRTKRIRNASAAKSSPAGMSVT